jgi:hypothetical protein
MNRLYLKVEFDPAYFGGNYSRTGNFALIPENLVDSVGMSAAFEHMTGHVAANIVHYAEDLRFNADGSPWNGEPKIIVNALDIQVPAVPQIEVQTPGVIELEADPQVEVEILHIELPAEPVIEVPKSPTIQVEELAK